MRPTSFATARHRTLAGGLAALLALGALPACAHAPVRLDLSPSGRPLIGTTIGTVTVAGALGAGGVDLSVRSGAALAGTPRRSTAPVVASASAARVLATADRYVGTRYRYGGESPATGFDCSGFVQYVFGRQGVELPRVSSQQASAGRAVPGAIGGVRPGDLMFFATEGRDVDHVAIYAGEGRIIHASAGSRRVRYDEIDTDRGDWYVRHFVAARRVLGEGRV